MAWLLNQVTSLDLASLSSWERVVRGLSKNVRACVCASVGDARDLVWSLGWEDPLEKEMATHSNSLAWKIPWAEEPGGLQSMGTQESDVIEGLSTHTHTHAHTYLRYIYHIWVAVSLIYIIYEPKILCIS